MKVLKAGLTNAYDGYYKGAGGLVIRVSGGYLTLISVGLNAYCQRDAKFMMRGLYTLDGYPLMIGRDGGFKASGSRSPNTVNPGELGPGRAPARAACTCSKASWTWVTAAGCRSTVLRGQQLEGAEGQEGLGTSLMRAGRGLPTMEP